MVDRARRRTRRFVPVWRLPRVARMPRGPAFGSIAARVHWRRYALVAVSGVALLTGGWWLYHSPLLSVQDVSVSGTVTLSPQQIEALADVDNESMISPDFGAASKRVKTLPMVKEVRITRNWPRGASIEVVERTPWGLWQVGAQSFVIDEEGVVIDVPVPPGAPAIAQTDTLLPPKPGDSVDRDAVALARILAVTAERTVERPLVRIEYAQGAGVTAIFGGAGQPELRAIFGGTEGLEFKVASLFAVLQQAREAGRVVRQVDLRFGDRVAVQADPPSQEGAQ
jgi:cell division protein FtsQ